MAKDNLFFTMIRLDKVLSIRIRDASRGTKHAPGNPHGSDVSTNERIHHMAVHVGQPVIATLKAISQPFVIEA